MKHFGQSLRKIFYSIDRGNRASYEQRKVVYDTMDWRSRTLHFVNPIKDLVVRGINLVRGSQNTEDKKGSENKVRGKDLTEVSADEDEEEYSSLEEMDSSADVSGESGLVDKGTDKMAVDEESAEGTPVVTRVISIRPKLTGKV